MFKMTPLSLCSAETHRCRRAGELKVHALLRSPVGEWRRTAAWGQELLTGASSAREKLMAFIFTAEGMLSWQEVRPQSRDLTCASDHVTHQLQVHPVHNNLPKNVPRN